ncbi:conserved Plasmodium protein, unknown function [Plasmodium sp. gorilla clade G3]|nr:conserved Plasmodium protein, unknown function [Plasmodium sp. gorilla clade G3]
MNNKLKENVPPNEDVDIYEKLKTSVINRNVEEFYEECVSTFLERLKNIEDPNHIICHHNYSDIVNFFYLNLFVDNSEFVRFVALSQDNNENVKICKRFIHDKNEKVVTENNESFQELGSYLKNIKLKYSEKLKKIKNVIIDNISNCQKCIMIYYLLQKKLLEKISSNINKKDDNVTNIIKKEIFEFNFYRIINKITCPIGYNNVDSVILELMLNGSKIFQMDLNYILEYNKINKVNLKIFKEKFMNYDNDEIYRIIKEYVDYDSLIFLCNLLFKEFKRMKNLLLQNDNYNNGNDTYIINENDSNNNNNKNKNNYNNDQICNDHILYNCNIQCLLPYIYIHIFILLKHKQVEETVRRVLKERIILYSLMLNSLRYSDNFIQLIIFKIINNIFIDEEEFLKDSNKKLISSIFSYWIKLSDGCIVKMINASMTDESSTSHNNLNRSGSNNTKHTNNKLYHNTCTKKTKTDDENFLKNNFTDYDIYKYMQSLICGLYLLTLIRKKKNKDHHYNNKNDNTNHFSSLKEYNMDMLSLNHFFTNNDNYIYLIGFMFSENKDTINNLFNLIFKLLYFIKYLKSYIVQNRNMKNKYFEDTCIYSSINILYNILEVTKKLFISYFHIDEYTKNLYKNYFRDRPLTFENMTFYIIPFFINNEDYYIRIYATKILIILLSDTNIRDSLDKKNLFRIFDLLINIGGCKSLPQNEEEEERKNINQLLLLLFKCNINDNKLSSNITNLIFSEKQKIFIKYILRLCNNEEYLIIHMKNFFDYFFVLLVKLINIIIRRAQCSLNIDKYKDFFMNIYEVVEIFMKELNKEKIKKYKLIFLSSGIYLCHLITNSIYKGKIHSSIPYLNIVISLIKNIEHHLNFIQDDLIYINKISKDIISDKKLLIHSEEEDNKDDDTKSIKDLHVLYFYNNLYSEELVTDIRNNDNVSNNDNMNNNINNNNNNNNNNNSDYNNVENIDYRYVKNTYKKNKNNDINCQNKQINDKNFKSNLLDKKGTNSSDILKKINKYDKFMKMCLIQNNNNDEIIYNYINCFFYLCVSNMNKRTRKNVVKSYDLIIKYILKDEYKMHRVKKKSLLFSLPIYIIRDVENEGKRYNLIIDKYDYILRSYIIDFFKNKKYLPCLLLSCLSFTNTMILFLKKKNFINSTTNNNITEKEDLLDCFMLVNSKTWFYFNVLVECICDYFIRSQKKLDIKNHQIKEQQNEHTQKCNNKIKNNNDDDVHKFSWQIINLIIDSIWKILIYIFYNIKINIFSIKLKTFSINIYGRAALLMFLKFYESWILFIKTFLTSEKQIFISRNILLPDLFYKKFGFLSSQILSYFHFIESNFLVDNQDEVNLTLLEKQKDVMNNILDVLIYFIKDKDPKGYVNELNSFSQFKLRIKKLTFPKKLQDGFLLSTYDDVFKKAKELLLRGDKTKTSELDECRGEEPNITSNCLKMLKGDNKENVININNSDLFVEKDSKNIIRIDSNSKDASAVEKDDNKEGKKVFSLEHAKKIIEKNAASKNTKRAIVLNENVTEKNKQQYFKEMKEKRKESENIIMKYFIMLQEFLNWDFFNLDNIEKYKNSISEELPIRFDSEEEYHKFFRPMALEECRCSMLNNMIGDINKYVISIVGKKKMSYWVIWHVSSSSENKRNLDNIKPMDLIALIPFDENKNNNTLVDNNDTNIKYDKLKEILKCTKHVIGLVDIGSNKFDNIFDIKLINEDNLPSKVDNEKTRLKLNFITCNKFHAYVLCNLMTNIREFQSIYLSRNCPLFNLILNPVGDNKVKKGLYSMKINDNYINDYNKEKDKDENDKLKKELEKLTKHEKLILKTLSKYNLLNESQIEAVKLILLNKNNISLIQGPPGTGKTKTVIGIVSVLYALIYKKIYEKDKKKKDLLYNEQNNNTKKKKILICSPSNSAIDEIAKRILNEGLLNFTNLINSYENKIKRNNNTSTKYSSNNKKKILFGDNDLHNSSDISDLLCEDQPSSFSNDKKDKSSKGILLKGVKNVHKLNNNNTSNEKINKFKKETIAPKCIRIGLSKRTHEEIQRISLDYIFNKKKSSDENLYHVHFDKKKNKLNYSMEAVDYTKLKMNEMKNNLSLNNSEKYSFDCNDINEKFMFKKVELIERFFSDELINNLDKKYLENLLYLYNESLSHYDWSIQKLTSERNYLDECMSRLIETDEQIGSFYTSNNKESMLSESEIIFSTLSGSASPVIENLEFEYLIIDEACQCVELSCLIPFRLKVKNIIMVGDPKQLPATTFSADCRKYGYSRSLFERLLLCNVSSVLLNIQYRMRPEICYFPNNYFYNGLIKNADILSSKPFFYYFQDLDFFGCYKFINIDGIESMTYNKSYINYVEAYFIYKLVLYIKNIISKHRDNSKSVPNLYKLPVHFSLKDIGIICPYQSQVHLIRNMFEETFEDKIPFPEVSTVDAFQGREKHIIIFSCVRSKLEVLENSKILHKMGAYKKVDDKWKKKKGRHGMYESDDNSEYNMNENEDNNNDNNDNIKSNGNEFDSDDDDKEWKYDYNDGVHTKKWISSKMPNIKNETDFRAIQKFGNNIGFLKDERRLNVALTRAKDYLWIIGNRRNLEMNETWDCLIQNAIMRKCYLDLKINFENSTTENIIKEKVNDFFIHLEKDINEKKYESSEMSSNLSSNSGIMKEEQEEEDDYEEITVDEDILFKNKNKFRLNKSQYKQNTIWNNPVDKEFSFSRAYTGNSYWSNYSNKEKEKNKNYDKKGKRKINDALLDYDLLTKRRKYDPYDNCNV